MLLFDIKIIIIFLCLLFSLKIFNIYFVSLVKEIDSFHQKLTLFLNLFTFINFHFREYRIIIIKIIFKVIICASKIV